MKRTFKWLASILFISAFLAACVEDGDPLNDPEVPVAPPVEQGPPVDLPENMEPEENFDQ